MNNNREINLHETEIVISNNCKIFACFSREHKSDANETNRRDTILVVFRQRTNMKIRLTLDVYDILLVCYW